MDSILFLLPKQLGPRCWSLVNRVMDYSFITERKVTCVSVYLFLQRSQSFWTPPEGEIQNLRTVIVTADIHRGLQSPAHIRRHVPPLVNLPALVRHHPLYILLRVRRELCFW